MIKALLLAGGFGRRLRPMVNDRPKPMALVAGKPFLEWIVEELRMQGVKQITMCTGHMGDQIAAHFGSGQAWGAEINYSREVEPLGTGGATYQAMRNATGSRFLVLNGDSFCPFNVPTLLNEHEKRSAAATLWLLPVSNSGRYGTVELGRSNDVTQFAEKAGQETQGLINTGVYVLERYIFKDHPAGRAISLEQDIFPSLVGHGLHGVIGTGPFLDIGTPESFLEAEAFMHNHCNRAQ